MPRTKKSGASGDSQLPPKKATTGYAYFVKENQETVKIDLKKGEKLLVERSKALGNLWREMEDEDKEPYTVKATADKLRYKKEMDVYRVNNPAVSKKKTKDPTMPKKYL